MRIRTDEDRVGYSLAAVCERGTGSLAAMPIRTHSNAVDNKGGGGSTTQSRASNDSRSEDWDSGGT